MRHRMMRLGHADLRIGARAHFARHLERDDSRDVGLHREHLQVEHQLDVLLPRCRSRQRTIEVGHLVDALLLGFLNPPLDLANGIEILVDLACDRRRRASAEGSPSLRDTASSMLPFRRCSPAHLLGAAAVAEQSLEQHARIRFGSAAASSETTTTDCSCRRRRGRCRNCRPGRRDRFRARATGIAVSLPIACAAI